MNEQMLAKLRRVLLLEEGAWEEVRDDATMTPIAAISAVVVIVLAGLGAYLWAEFNAPGGPPSGYFVDTVILGSIFTALLWLAWLVVTYVVLTQVFRATVAPDALFRVGAVALIPYILTFLVFIPEINFWLATGSLALVVFLTVFGIQSAFGVQPFKALVSVLAGFSVFAIVLALLITVNNSFATGPFVFELSEDIVTKSYDTGDFEFDFDPEDINLDDLFETEPGQ